MLNLIADQHYQRILSPCPALSDRGQGGYRPNTRWNAICGRQAITSRCLGERQIRRLVEIPTIKIEDFLPSVDRCMHAVGISINREKRMPDIVVRVEFVGFAVLLERLRGDRDILR